MRYYFHLEKGTSVYVDHRGRDFADLQGVTAYAHETARTLAQDEIWDGWSVRVIDARNTEVLCLPLAEAAMTK